MDENNQFIVLFALFIWSASRIPHKSCIYTWRTATTAAGSANQSIPVTPLLFFLLFLSLFNINKLFACYWSFFWGSSRNIFTAFALQLYTVAAAASVVVVSAAAASIAATAFAGRAVSVASVAASAAVVCVGSAAVAACAAAAATNLAS